MKRGLLDLGIEPLDYNMQVLGGQQPMQSQMQQPAQQAMQESQQQAEPSMLEKILTYTPGINAFYLAGKNILDQRRLMANQPRGDYAEIARYHAERGNPDLAAKYMELAQAGQPKAREVFARSENVVDPQTGQSGMLLTYRNGEQEFKPVQYAAGASPAARAAAIPKLPVGYMWDAEAGRAVPVPGITPKVASAASSVAKPAAAKPVKTTEDERKAAGWLEQARKASSDMMDAYRTNPMAAMPGLIEQYAPIEEVKNVSRSPERQRYAQAAAAFAEATLRAATGAGVTTDEASQKIRELTPQRGDSDEVIRQKMASQMTYLKALEARAGNAAMPVGKAKPSTMSKLPPASQHPGRIVVDTEYGRRFRSNGKTWEPL